MSDVLLHSRPEVFGPNAFPTSSSGLVRPALKANRPIMTVHYVGSGTFIDSGDTPNEMRAIHAYASSPQKNTPWEYNYVVDGDGELWTYAGERVAAHSAGNNTESIGVLALAGLNDPVPDAMVLGLRKMRWMLMETGLLARAHQLLPHRQMPGANTACPGPQVLSRWGEIAEPWTPQPDPLPIVEEPMQVRYRDARYHNIWLVGAAPALNLSGELDAYYASKGVDLIEGVHDQMLSGLLMQSGLSRADLVPR